MGEAKMLTTLSQTSSGKRRLNFEPGASRELSLKRHSTFLKARFHCCHHDESLFGRDLTFRRPVDFSSRKSSQKECFAPRKECSAFLSRRTNRPVKQKITVYPRLIVPATVKPSLRHESNDVFNSGRSMERHRRVVRSTLRLTFSSLRSALFQAQKHMKQAFRSAPKASEGLSECF